MTVEKRKKRAMELFERETADGVRQMFQTLMLVQMGRGWERKQTWYMC